MKQFPRLKEFFEENKGLAEKLNYNKDSIIKLEKPLYGLKQSGNCWQVKIRSIMRKHGFNCLVSDNAIYQNRTKSIIVASYVDDFLLVGPNKSDLQKITRELNKEVPLNDLGEANWFLGVRIRRLSPTGAILLDQEQYLKRSFAEMSSALEKQYPETPLTPSCKADMKRYTGKATATELYNYQL
ncbi:hypothetical protein K3495_g16745 [Podosphaera aphanis]|nr:hypothetical protein K3495_g16745 [Podosphaera aphanis]